MSTEERADEPTSTKVPPLNEILDTHANVEAQVRGNLCEFCRRFRTKPRTADIVECDGA